MNISLNVERLVLDGLDLDARGRGVLQTAFEAELTRLLTEGGIAQELSGGRALAALQLPELATPPGATPRQLGLALASSIYSGIGQ